MCRAPRCDVPLPKTGRRTHYCDIRCATRARYAREKVERAADSKALRDAVIGRVCKWCACSDAVVGFPESTVCSRCQRQIGRRRTCGLCDGPFFTLARGGREAGCVAKCKTRRTCALDGCDAVLPVLPVFGGWGRPRKWCSVKCRMTGWRRAHSVEQNAYKAARRAATLGRVCKWCECTDEHAGFVARKECSACHRTRSRSFCTLCKGPFMQRRSVRGHPVGCVVRNRIPFGLSCRKEMARHDA